MANERYLVNNTAADSYQIWMSKSSISPTDWVRVKRLKVESFRNQPKGLGSGSATLLENVEKASGPEDELGSNFPLLAERNFIKIMDTTRLENYNGEDLNPSNYPSQIAFFGYITTITSDVFEKPSSPVTEGSVSFNEIGWLLQEQIVDGIYFSEDGQKLETPPSFNQRIDDRVFGNKAPGNKFLQGLFEVSEEGRWRDGYDDSKVWNIGDVLSLVVESASFTLNFTVPNVDYFTRTDPPRSISSYKGKSISKCLDDLIVDPHSYDLRYDIGGDEVDIEVFTNVNVNISGYVEPVTGQMFLDDYQVREFSITRTEKKADKVIVRNPNGGILVGFPMCPWIHDNQNNIAKAWNDPLEEKFIRGTKQIGSVATNSKEADRYRNTVDDVYRKFSLLTVKDVQDRDVLFLTDNIGDVKASDDEDDSAEETPREKIAVFPRFDLENTDINGFPAISGNYQELANNHATPNPLSIRWSPKFPYYRRRKEELSGDEEYISDNYIQLDPMAVVFTIDSDGELFPIDTIALANLMNTPIKNKLSFTGYDIYLDVTPAPQLYAWDNRDLAEGGNTEQIESNSWDNSIAGPSQWDPNLGELFQDGGKGHWSRFLFQGAAFSDQQFSIEKTATYFNEQTGQEEEVPNPQNIVVIDDPSIELWYCHKGCVIDFDYDTDNLASERGSLERFTEDTFTRNDLPYANELLETAFQWMTLTRRAATIEINWHSWDNQFKVGDTLTTITDGASGSTENVYEINTAISSISYMNLSSTNPKVVISTEIAKVPDPKRISHEARNSLSGVRFDSSRTYDQVNVSNREVEDESNNTVQVGENSLLTQGGGGGGGSTYFICKVLGGNSMPLDEEGSSYPNEKPFAISMDLSDENGNLVVNPTVEDWTEFDVPTDYRLGDNLEGNLPNGICYLQLQRPYSVGGSSWNANLEFGLAVDSDDGDPLVATRATSQDNFNTITLHMNRDFTFFEGVNASSFRLEVKEGEEDQSADHVIEAFTKEDNKVILTLSKAVDTLIQTSILSVPANTMKYTYQEDVGESNDEPVKETISNGPIQLEVDYLGDRFTLIYGLNKTSNQLFTQGDLVLVDVNSISISDELDEPNRRNVYNIIGPVSSAQVHDHQTYNKDGLGRANFTI